MRRTVQFTHTGHSHIVGNFSAGDRYTGDEAACRHFVDEAGCAEWADLPAQHTEPEQPPAPEPEQPPAPDPEQPPAPEPVPETVQTPAPPAPRKRATN